jgi:hypothetical protein
MHAAFRRGGRKAIETELQGPSDLSADEHERAEHYLQRFWRHLPQNGQIVVFDRPWYGRVLVERVEGFATEVEWRRASSDGSCPTRIFAFGLKPNLPRDISR